MAGIGGTAGLVANGADDPQKTKAFEGIEYSCSFGQAEFGKGRIGFVANVTGLSLDIGGLIYLGRPI